MEGAFLTPSSFAFRISSKENSGIVSSMETERAPATTVSCFAEGSTTDFEAEALLSFPAP